MLAFSYKAKGMQQGIVEGVVVADSQQAAVVKIMQLGLTPILIEPTTDVLVPQKTMRNSVLMAAPRISARHLAYFIRSLSDLLDAGVSLVVALDVLSKQRIPSDLKTVILRMRLVIQDGASLSKSMEAFPHIFNKLFVSMVKSSEAAGNLARSLAMLAQNLEKNVTVQRRIQSALLYPMMILAVGIVAIIVLLTFVLPKLSAMFDDFGADLPMPTLIVLGLSHLLVSYGWILAVGIVVLIISFLQFRKSAHGELIISRWVLRIPLVSDFLKAIYIARYTRTLAVLLESGVPITMALESSATVIDNIIFLNQAKQIASQVRQGTSLSSAVKSASVFGDLVANLISVGEQGGRLESNLFKIASIYEDESQQMTENSLNALGPSILIVVVLLVGGMMFAIILPLIKMNMIIK